MGLWWWGSGYGTQTRVTYSGTRNTECLQLWKECVDGGVEMISWRELVMRNDVRFGLVWFRSLPAHSHLAFHPAASSLSCAFTG